MLITVRACIQIILDRIARIVRITIIIMIPITIIIILGYITRIIALSGWMMCSVMETNRISQIVIEIIIILESIIVVKENV